MRIRYFFISLLIVGATARSSGYFPSDRIIWGREPVKEPQRPKIKRTKDMDKDNNFVPVLTSGMNIHSDAVPSFKFGNDDQKEEEVPSFSSGMIIPGFINKREINNNGEAPKTTTNGKRDDEKWLSTLLPKLDGKQEELDQVSETTREGEEEEDEINVQVNVDTTADVSTQIIRPHFTTGGDKKKTNKLIIKINVKIKKDEPNSIKMAKKLFGEDYDQKTCDWLNALHLNQKSDTTPPSSRSQTQRVANGSRGPVVQTHSETV